MVCREKKLRLTLSLPWVALTVVYHSLQRCVARTSLLNVKTADTSHTSGTLAPVAVQRALTLLPDVPLFTVEVGFPKPIHSRHFYICILDQK